MAGWVNVRIVQTATPMRSKTNMIAATRWVSLTATVSPSATVAARAQLIRQKPNRYECPECGANALAGEDHDENCTEAE